MHFICPLHRLNPWHTTEYHRKWASTTPVSFCLSFCVICLRVRIHWKQSIWFKHLLTSWWFNFLTLLAESEFEGDSRSYVDLRGFYNRNCLCLAVAALSSYSRHLRGLAKAVLARYYQLAEQWVPTRGQGPLTGHSMGNQFPERLQVSCFITIICHRTCLQINYWYWL